MIDFRINKLLVIQALLLSAWGILLFLLHHVALKTDNLSSFWISYWFYWPCFIIINMLFLKFFALPSKTILKAVSSAHANEDMTWSMIEDTLNKKDQHLLTLQTQYEKENLKYRTLLDSLSDPVFIYDESLVVTYFNQAFQTFFNIHFSNILKSCPLIEITRNHEFYEILLTAQRKSTKDTPAKFTNFSFNQIQDPHKVFFEIKISPMKNLSGHLCLMHDTTQMKMAELMREDFVSNFSHEVRTPLTILNGQLQNLKQNLLPAITTNKELQTVFDKIDNNSRRLINLFNDLLRLTSIEKKIELYYEEVNVEQMIETLCEELLVNYPGKKVAFKHYYDQTNFWVDYNLFEQAMINLIDNALKYSAIDGVDGQVTFKSYCEEINDEKLNVLEISDNGLGIPEDQLHRIF